jgi:hypothetical protein
MTEPLSRSMAFSLPQSPTSAVVIVPSGLFCSVGRMR